MKLLVVFAFLIVAISAASDQERWAEFKNNHGKTYKSLREEKLRFNIFQQKLREIESHNEKYEKGEVSYFLAVNQFSDMTSEEFLELLNKNIATKPDLHATPEEGTYGNDTIPDTMNWVEKGAVLRVKDQGDCGSCWAFSTTGSIEGQNIIINSNKVSLSEQQLVDCSKQNAGCDGGDMRTAYRYVMNDGLGTESDYPYTGVDGECKYARSAVKLKGFSVVPTSEYSLQSAIANVGPISVGVEATLWQSYGGGVFDNSKCIGWNLNHGVLAVGYGLQDEKKYWLIKNSWGTSWGENGYIRLVRDKMNQCGISKDATYPRLHVQE